MAGHDTSTGVTAGQKSQLKRQFEARLKSRAQTRGASARRTGKDVKDLNRKLGVGLMPKKLRSKTGDTPMTQAMRDHVKTLDKGNYASEVKKAWKGAETDHSKSSLFGTGGGGRHKVGSYKTGQKRKDVRAWSENIMSAYEKKRDTGKLSTADFATKRANVAKRRKHLIGKES
jgi:hypothetical protein